MKICNFVIALGLCLSLSTSVAVAYAQSHDSHMHEETHEKHTVTESGGHDDHNDHSEEGDSHDEYDHDAHEEQDIHDDHGHGAEDKHDDEHGEHEDSKTEISSEMAYSAGIVTEQADSKTIAKTVALTGRIIINQNAKANVRARFSGIIRSVNVNLGEAVEKGQLLAVVEANESLKDYSVTAPINGVILERNTNLGDVANGKPLFVIADLSEVWAKFHIFPKDADRIKSGQNVRVHTLDEGKQGVAKIDMLFPMADEASQTLVAIAPLSNQSGLWRPGMTVEGDVIVAEKPVPLAVRVSALQTMEDRTVVFLKEGNSYEAMPVQTGISDGEYVEVLSGIQAGQEYVSEGSFIIKADIMKAGAEHHH
ncbi:MAG: HlyD family efflux transporter periplasmic adaptor subunit [Pseudomonadota bacterium]|nr:HlyD family efflux transporter periplasmic adaptor subunit [Pseudomonadota bacterium]QKK04252.1 MAG: HlyD family efflux transporter periplasmic adaptor subunit [Pseudomonadota bacterium]